MSTLTTERRDPTRLSAEENSRRRNMLRGLFAVLPWAVLSLGSWAVGAGPLGYVAAFALGVGLVVVVDLRSDHQILARISAHDADPRRYARLHNVTEGLCVTAGIPKPRLCIIDDEALNALVTQRSESAATIVVTTGLVEGFDRIELEAALAHLLSRIKSGDARCATFAAVTLRVPLELVAQRRRHDPQSVFAKLFATILRPFTPVFTRLLGYALSDEPFGDADFEAVALTRYPPGLIRALEHLSGNAVVSVKGVSATTDLWIEQPDLPTVPAAGDADDWGRLERHPHIDERIERLREL